MMIAKLQVADSEAVLGMAVSVSNEYLLKE